MDIAAHRREDPLSLPLRARLFEALVELRRPASTQELAELVTRHHNTVRRQLGRLADAGLVDARTVRRTRGRPRQEWTVAPDASPGGRPPESYAALGRWLARAVGHGGGLEAVEAIGREIGHEIAPAAGRPVGDAMRDALASLGFAPRREAEPPSRLRYVLANCPYRDAVRENQPAVCTLHRGITRGLLDHLGPGSELTGFVPRDPDAAGCVIDIATP